MTECPVCGKQMESRGLVVVDRKELFSIIKNAYVPKLIWNKLLQCPGCSRIELIEAEL